MIDKQEAEINNLRFNVKKLAEGGEDVDNMKNVKLKYQTDILELKEKTEFFENQLEQKQAALKQFLEQNMD